MLDCPEGVGEVPAQVVPGVVGEHCADGDPVIVEELSSPLPEARAGRSSLVGEDLRVRQAAGTAQWTKS